jgi:hypothetical protein
MFFVAELSLVCFGAGLALIRSQTSNLTWSYISQLGDKNQWSAVGSDSSGQFLIAYETYNSNKILISSNYGEFYFYFWRNAF